MSKRMYLNAIVSIALLLAVPCMLTAETGSKAIPDHVALTWTANPQTTQTITWRTSQDVKSNVIEFVAGKKLTASAKKITVAGVEYKTDLGTDTLFSSTITGLKEDTEYAYRVGDGKNWSAESTFRTAGNKNLEFLVFGDSQSGNATKTIYEPWKATVEAAFTGNKNARFMVNVGDLVEIGYMQSHWNAWFDAAKNVIARIPEMPVQGNHETYTDGTENTSDKPAYWLAQLPTPTNGPDGLKGQVYSYSIGNVDFFVLDSQEDEESPKYGDILNAQGAWLDKALAASKADFKLAFFHKTPYSNKAARPNEQLKSVFCPILEKYHVDVAFNGHDHGVSRTYPVSGNTFFSEPKDGTVYYITGRSGNKYYNDLSNKFWNAYFYDPQDQPVYLVVDVNGKMLTITTKKTDGTIVDSYVIDKAGSKSTRTPVPGKFNVTRTAVEGSYLTGAAINPSLVKKNDTGVWFVDLNHIAANLGATVSLHDGAADFSIGGKTVKLPADSLIAETGKPVLVSIDSLKAADISAIYYDNLNVLSLIR